MILSGFLILRPKIPEIPKSQGSGFENPEKFWIKNLKMPGSGIGLWKPQNFFLEIPETR